MEQQKEVHPDTVDCRQKETGKMLSMQTEVEEHNTDVMSRKPGEDYYKSHTSWVKSLQCKQVTKSFTNVTSVKNNLQSWQVLNDTC